MVIVFFVVIIILATGLAVATVVREKRLTREMEILCKRIEEEEKLPATMVWERPVDLTVYLPNDKYMRWCAETGQVTTGEYTASTGV